MTGDMRSSRDTMYHRRSRPTAIKCVVVEHTQDGDGREQLSLKRVPARRLLTFPHTSTKCAPRNIPSAETRCRPRIMNSYPPELLAQLAPVMFVAGLGAPQQPPTSPQSPAPKPQDPFSVLALRLKDVLQAQRRPAVWQPDKSKTFQVVFVEPVRTQSHAISQCPGAPRSQFFYCLRYACVARAILTISSCYTGCALSPA